ncbi:MAG: nucleotidyltransferase domain-containing protein [Thermomicrobiales bacterium]
MVRRRADATEDVARKIARRLGDMPGVIAVAIGGSAARGSADGCSDVDLYVYAPEPPPLDLRADLARTYDPAPEIDNRAFGPGDEWGDEATGLAVDVIYWSPAWIEEQLARVLDQHAPSVGYSTCFWRTVRSSVPLIDPTGWFAALQASADRPYPEPLRQAIIATNRPLLRQARSSFLHQIECAVERNDPVSVHHRTTELLASFFDVLFALNRVPHPGETRLLTIARAECPLLPPDLAPLVGNLIAATVPPWDDGRLAASAHALIDSLEDLLAASARSEHS